MEGKVVKELLMYTTEEVAGLFHVSTNQVGMWRECGVILAIKTGKNYMYTFDAIKQFQDDYTGQDVSNYDKAVNALKNVKEQKGEINYVY